MANSTNINNPETTTNAQIQGAGLVLPLSVNERGPNKISTLFTPNSSVLYSKYSPYPEGQSGGFFGANQPYIVTNINDANKGINSTLKYAPLQPAATIDVVRVTKYSASNPGIKFLLKQIYLQGYQPFNETKLYNPLMPIQATLRVASFGILDRPLRHIEPNLSGVLGILGVKGIAGAFGFNPPNPPPRGTAPGKNGGLFGLFQGSLDKPLSITNPGDGKGLTRGGTATSAYSGQNYSYLSRPSRTGFLQNIGNFFKSSTLFGTFFAIGQPAGTIYKGDDNTYSLMLESKRIVSLDKSGVNTYGTNGVVQRWDADKDRSAALFYQTNPSKFSRYLTQYSSGFDYLQSKYSNQSLNIDVNSFKITDGKPKNLIGYNSYADAVGILLNGTETSDVLFLYNDYLKNNNYPTKLKSPRKIDSIIHDPSGQGYVIEDGGYIKETGILNSLGKPIDKSPIIANEYKDYIDPNFTETSYPTKLTSLDNILSDDNIYTRERLDKIEHIKSSGQGYVIDPNGQTIGYENNNVNKQTKTPEGDIKILFTNNYPLQNDTGKYPTTFIKGKNIFGQEQIDFANEKNQALTEILKSNYAFVPPTDLNKVRGIIDSSKTDKKNSLSYLAKYRKYKNGEDLLDDPNGKGFAGVNQSDLINVLHVQSKTDDFINKDLIKFYFYDIYNKKYIPFRATVKGISERSVSSWDDFQYIGNADKVYNYKGFTRGLGFNFTVLAMSVKELLPMWQRINYLMGLTKPANYKNGFIVPPLVMMTIGDIYKNQPIVINSINMTIPDNATWETISESEDKFEYLNGRLKSNDNVTLAQFPREAEISIDANILEKEKPKVGRNNFGDFNTGPFSDKLSVLASAQEMQQQEEFNARRTGEIDMMEVG